MSQVHCIRLSFLIVELDLQTDKGVIMEKIRQTTAMLEDDSYGWEKDEASKQCGVISGFVNNAIIAIK